MTSPSVTVLRRLPGRAGAGRRPGAVPLDPAETLSNTVRRRVYTVWALLYFNTLTYSAGATVLHLPSKVGKGLAQGALPLAILVALTINPKIKIRPNVFLCLVGLLVVDTVITCLAAPHLGSIFRSFRLAEFVAALWLLTPWWGRRDMLLMRCHLRWLYISLASVLVGLMISPHKAFSYTGGGRLSGVIWPMLPTQVAQYGAIAAGLTIILWLARLVRGRVTVFAVAFAMAILLETHTRTALAGLLAGILVGGLSMFTSNARVRKFFGAGLAAVLVGAFTVVGVVTTWLARGENAQGLASLTGRTNFWALVLDTPRTKFQEIFGFGLSNASINGLPIDSNWLSSYMQEGLFGVVVCALILVWLFVAAFFRPPSVQRALGLFLLTYCLVASFTEDAFTNASTYLLALVVAASLLVPPLIRPEDDLIDRDQPVAERDEILS